MWAAPGSHQKLKHNKINKVNDGDAPLKEEGFTRDHARVIWVFKGEPSHCGTFRNGLINRIFAAQRRSFPPCSSSSLPPLLLPPYAGAPLSFVWLLILAKRTDQIFLLQRTRLSAGASQIWWLGLTDGRGPGVLKSGTDSGGFDSPRSSHTGSPKRPGKKRGGGGGEGVRVSGNKSICGVVRAGGGSDSRHHGLFEVYTRTPSFLPQKLCFLCPRSHVLLVAALQPCVSCFTRRRRLRL